MSDNTITFKLDSFREEVDITLAGLNENKVIQRIWQHDHTLWKSQPTEISNRLGWLKIADNIKKEIPQIKVFVEEIRSAGYTQALLLGMGGSSLAPELFRKTFGVKDGFLDLAVLDSTDPETVESQDQQLDYSKTLFIVSTKSGGTVETLSFFNYFFTRAVKILGADQAGAHFVAITDSGSRLESLAKKNNFRKIFLNDRNIGGRFSVLSFFGIVPAALLGMDIGKLLDSAILMARQDDLGAKLGAIMGTFAKAEPSKRDKITFFFSDNISSFGDWIEQLIAESTGKEGVGILPIVGESLGIAEVYVEDRLFVHLKLGDDPVKDVKIQELEEAGHPIVRIQLVDSYDLGGQFFLWELATAVAGHILKINPFEQPNVESAKVLARKMVNEFKENGVLPTIESTSLSLQTLHHFLEQSKPGDYIALQAYLPPTQENEAALQDLRLKLRDHYKLATTLGFGPRFLHSTGQLHKGDSGNGLFIQFTNIISNVVAIPDEAGSESSSISFGTLKNSQALGDAQALLDAGRRLIHFQLGRHPAQEISNMLKE